MRRSTSDGMRRRELPRRENRLMRLMADRLSVYHWKEHLCLVPHSLERDVSSRRAEAQPPSLLQVDVWDSMGPSTGPDPRYRISFPVLSTHPCVAELLCRPPSEATCNFHRDRKDLNIVASSDICSRPSSRRLWEQGRVLKAVKIVDDGSVGGGVGVLSVGWLVESGELFH